MKKDPFGWMVPSLFYFSVTSHTKTEKLLAVTHRLIMDAKRTY